MFLCQKCWHFLSQSPVAGPVFLAAVTSEFSDNAVLAASSAKAAESAESANAVNAKLSKFVLASTLHSR
jgi:hypothetical protein